VSIVLEMYVTVSVNTGMLYLWTIVRNKYYIASIVSTFAASY